MADATVPIRRPSISPIRQTSDPTFWFTGALVAALRGAFRVQEFFATGRKRERLRTFRTQMDAIRRDSDAMLRRLEQPGGADPLDILDGFVAEHAHLFPPDMAALRQEHRAARNALRREGDELQAIVRAAGDDKAGAAAGLREYVRAHPASRLGFSYLGGVLHQLQDWGGSLAAYDEEIRLAAGEPFHEASARLSRGKVLLAMGDTEGAVAAFRRIVQETPAASGAFVCLAYLYLGDALAQGGDRRNARVAWRQVRTWNQTTAIVREAQARLRWRWGG